MRGTEYVCAFRGRRDSYQVPRALKGAGRLDQFITDLYVPPALQTAAAVLPSPWDEKLASRWADGLPPETVRCLWGTTLWEWGRHAMGMPKAQTYASLDPIYARAAARRARRTRSDLLLYTPYAWEAFTASYDHEPRRVLFQYHPHAVYERRVLARDAERASDADVRFDTEHRAETGASLREDQQRRIEEAWTHADMIVCASSFTKQTLVEAGADPDTCAVVPYGVDLPDQESEERLSGFKVLFVGSGVQRKGLHHLLWAWEKAERPADSHLTLVCRTIDPALARLAEDTADTTLNRGVSYERLLELYRTHTLFAMPSLIEGFGQVYLEAMSQGCPVLGTPHTCLPDVGTEREGVFTVSPGDVSELVSRLERLAGTLPDTSTYNWRARDQAQEFTWGRFRTRLVELL